MAKPIYFYSKDADYYWLSNFAPYGFELDGVHWPTVEHYFQAAKFVGDDLATYRERIRAAHSARQAKALGRSQAQPLRPDWEEVKEAEMLKALRAKFSNADLRGMLLETGRRPLVEASPSDRYWGAGSDGGGKNRLGALLMQVRAELRDPSPGTVR